MNWQKSPLAEVKTTVKHRAQVSTECRQQRQKRRGDGRPLRLGILALVATWLLRSAAAAASLTHIGTFEWPTEVIVGLSGLEVSEDGERFVAIGDRGWQLSGQFIRDNDRITDIKFQNLEPILGNNGLPVAARRVGDWSDAEGLAIAADGTQWISFERWAHVSRYIAPGKSGQWIKDHPNFSDFKDNRQLEALAIHPNGALYTFPERPLKDGFPIFKLADDTWMIDGYILEKDGFSIVGADFDDTGQLYILERKLVLGLWWQNRIQRLDVIAPQTTEILWTSNRGDYYNLEGIAVWRDDQGLRITMVSDNNGDRSEPTQFVEFRLIE